MDGYSRGEVVYLLSLERGDALIDDASQPDSLARVSSEGPGAPTAYEQWDPVFTIGRWHDVQAARRRVVRQKMEEADTTREQVALETRILALRARGLTEEEVGRLVGMDRLAARRRFTAAVDEILEELGGELDSTPTHSVVSACLACGKQPRARARERRVRRAGRHPRVIEERQMGVCWDCLPEKARARAVPPKTALSVAV